MLLPTHRLISNKIYKAINTALNIELDKKYFTYGNVKPDIDLNLVTKSHRISLSLNFLLNQIDRVMHNKYNSIKEFSIDLGVVNHFLCDFFCYAHNEELTGNMPLLQHLNYEMQLHKKFKEIDQNINLEFSQRDLWIIRKYKPVDIILKLQEAYYQRESYMISDVEFSLKASFVITLYIIENAMFFKGEREVA